jgi:hypothetical protein
MTARKGRALASIASFAALVACSSSGSSPSEPSSATGSDGGSSSGSGASSGSSGGSGGSSGSGAAPEGGVAPASTWDGGTYLAPAGPVDFGPNVLIFDPSMDNGAIQSKIDSIFNAQQTNQFGTDRYAYFFKPGSYSLDVQLGFYMQVLGLGTTPDAVTITGAVRSMAKWMQGNATQNFWRVAENLAVTPSAAINKSDVWAVSQGTALRRIHAIGGVTLFDPEGGPNDWSSGGFIADSKIDGTLVSGSQQQFLTRNVTMQQWNGGVWNMVFVGDQGDPTGTWPASPYTFVTSTPVIREKPYLTIDASGAYSVVVPGLAQNTEGTTWASGTAPATPLSIDTFYVAHSDKDSADTINAALAKGANLILTPGVYHLASALQIGRPGTVVLGLGLATLVPDDGTPALVAADVDGVTVAGVLFDAGAEQSPTLLQLGGPGNAVSHSSNPSALFDIACRVGGPAAGLTKSCVTIDSDDVLLDEVWLWRADHGTGVGWTANAATNGIVVNGANVSAYGLFVEHFQEYQTLWNGDGGRVLFYQSEIPYDVPAQAQWTHDGENGYASFKVANGVTRFDGRGLGIYCYFDNPVVLDNAVESPTVTSAPGVTFQHIVTQWFKNAAGSAINHIINGTGAAVNASNTGATTPN